MRRFLFVFFLCFWTFSTNAQTFNLIDTPSPLATTITFPKIETWRRSGAKIYFAARPELPMVDIRLVFDAGAARDPISGVAALTNSMLEAGTSQLSATQIAEAFEREGALLELSSFRDMAIIGLRSLNDPVHLNSAINTLSQILTGSTFPTGEFERSRNKLLTAIQQAEASLEYQLERAFYKALYKEHPYARPPWGDYDSVQKIGREAVISFYEAHYVATNLTIAVVGALTLKDAKALVEELLAYLPRGEKPKPLPPVPSSKQKEEVSVAFSSAQTHIALGLPTVTRRNQDYFILALANQILGGGGLVSILHNALREREGLTYAVESVVIPMNQSGPFMIRFQTRNHKAKHATQIVLKALQDFVATGPTQDQLQLAKSQLIGSMPFSLASNQALTGELAMIGFYDLSPDYLKQYHRTVLNATEEQVRAIFNQYISLEQLRLVTVGNGS